MHAIYLYALYFTSRTTTDVSRFHLFLLISIFDIVIYLIGLYYVIETNRVVIGTTFSPFPYPPLILFCHIAPKLGRRALIPLQAGYDWLQQHYSPLWLRCRLYNVWMIHTNALYFLRNFKCLEFNLNFEMITLADFPYFYICSCQHAKV